MKSNLYGKFQNFPECIDDFKSLFYPKVFLVSKASVLTIAQKKAVFTIVVEEEDSVIN